MENQESSSVEVSMKELQEKFEKIDAKEFIEAEKEIFEKVSAETSKEATAYVPPFMVSIPPPSWFMKTNKNKMEQASSVTNKYALAAATAGATPIPFSDAIPILAAQSAMIVHISKIYGFDFDMQSGKKIITALAGVFSVGLLTRTALASAIKFIPGVGSVIGGVINAAVAFGVTKAIGELYSKCLYEKYDEYLDKLDLDKLDLDKLIDVVKTYIAKQEIQEIVRKFILENLLSKLPLGPVGEAIREVLKKIF